MKLIQLISIIFLGLTTNIWALSSDRSKPINISSDSQSLDLKNNHITFIDNVVITQGSVKINADRVHVEKTNKGEKIKANGSPVYFEQLLDDGKLIKGTALQASYNVITQQLELSGNSHIISGQSSIKANNINYNIAKQELVATKGGKNRVRTIIEPNEFKQN